MMKSYLVFDFGESFFRNARVVDLVIDKMPVSISLGLWTTLLIYLISIPLGIAKAVRDGSRFDVVDLDRRDRRQRHPGLPVRAAAGRAVRRRQLLSRWFPLRGLVSDDWAQLSWPATRSLDYFWHMALPIVAMVIGGFATLTMLTKNSFLEEINKQYVLTARAKGLIERRVLYGHVFRNAMLIVDRRLPGRLHRRAVHRLAADRGHLLARRPRPARLRGGDQPRLSGDVRHALLLRPARPADGHHRRPDVHARRSAHRLRGARR